MAKVRIKPGGVVLLAVVVFGALLFLFFELKPASTPKEAVKSTAPLPVAKSRETPRTPAQTAQVPASVTQKPPAQQYAVKAPAGNSPVRIYFDFNRAAINKNVYCIFDRIEQIVKQSGGNSLRIVVEGNADSIGPSWYNVELSRKRAARVADSLARRLGIPLDRITLVANGSNKPIAPNSTRDGRADNRRTDIVIYH